MTARASAPLLRPAHLDGPVLVLFGLLCSPVGAGASLVPSPFDSALLPWGGSLVGAAGVCWHALVRPNVFGRSDGPDG